MNSIMAGIIVGDSSPIDPKRLTLSQKIDYTLSKTERTFPLLRETIMPETRVLFELTIDTQICQYKIEDIKAALELFNEICYERFYSHFGRGDNRKGIVWIGGGVGYLSKTVIYSLLTGKPCRWLRVFLKEHYQRKFSDSINMIKIVH